MRVALYLRKSTSDDQMQVDSLPTQEKLLTAYAAKYDHEVVEIFRDSASGRSADRPEFQRLIAAVQQSPVFDAILCRDISRWADSRTWTNPRFGARQE